MSKISRSTAKHRIIRRWNEQCERFPAMRKEIPLELYMRRNLALVIAGGLFAEYAP